MQGGVSGSPNSAGIGRRLSMGARAYGSLRSNGSGSSSGSGGLPTIPAGGTTGTGSPPASHRMSRKSCLLSVSSSQLSHTNSLQKVTTGKTTFTSEPSNDTLSLHLVHHSQCQCLVLRLQLQPLCHNRSKHNLRVPLSRHRNRTGLMRLKSAS